MATLFLIVGLPAAGKTMRAMDLAEEHAALRLTPDAWMIPLFGDPQPVGKRDVLEGRLIWLALEVLRLGTNVVLDFGLWTRDERSSLRWLAGSVSASCQVVYLFGGPRDATRADQAPLDANTRSDVRDDRGRCGSMARPVRRA
jgi:predicted kinase